MASARYGIACVVTYGYRYGDRSLHHLLLDHDRVTAAMAQYSDPQLYRLHCRSARLCAVLWRPAMVAAHISPDSTLAAAGVSVPLTTVFSEWPAVAVKDFQRSTLETAVSYWTIRQNCYDDWPPAICCPVRTVVACDAAVRVAVVVAVHLERQLQHRQWGRSAVVAATRDWVFVAWDFLAVALVPSRRVR